MEAVLRKYTSFDEMKADEYRYWQSRPVHERMEAVEEMVLAAYALKGWEIEPDVPRRQRPFVRLQCPWRSSVFPDGVERGVVRGVHATAGQEASATSSCSDQQP